MTLEEDDELNLEELSPLMQSLIPKVAACQVREFAPDDLESCVEVWTSNQPGSVDAAARESFIDFLRVGTTYLLVVEHAGDVIACGGIEMVGDPDSATLVKTMVHREYQRRGFGSALLAAQLSLLEYEGRPIDLWIHVEDESAGFYERLGFEMRSSLEEPASGKQLLWRDLSSGDIEDARAVLIERQIQLTLNADEDGDEDEGEVRGSSIGYEEEEY